MSELVKQIRTAHLSLLLASAALIVSTIADRESLRTSSQTQLHELRKAIERWEDLDRRELRSELLDQFYELPGVQETIDSTPFRSTRDAVAPLLRDIGTIDGEPPSSDLVTQFIDNTSKHIVVTERSTVLGEDIPMYLVIDPVWCTRGRLHAGTLGDLPAFWSDLIEPNRCLILKGLRSEIEFPHSPPQDEDMVMAALVYEDVALITSGVLLTDILVKAADPHTGSGPYYSMELRTVLLGARNDSTETFRAIRPGLSTSALVEVVEVQAPPLLPFFDPQERWLLNDLGTNFPDLIELTKNYPDSIALEDLDKIIRMEAARDRKDFQAVGLTIPSEVLTAVGLPVLAFISLFLLVQMRVLRKSLIRSEPSREPGNIAWIGVNLDSLSQALFVVSAIIAPASASLLRLSSAVGKEALLVVAIAIGSCVLLSTSSVYLLAEHRAAVRNLRVSSGS